MLWVVTAHYPSSMGHPPDKVLVEADDQQSALDLAFRFHKYRQIERFQSSLWGTMTVRVTAQRIKPIDVFVVADLVDQYEAKEYTLPKKPDDGIPI